MPDVDAGRRRAEEVRRREKHPRVETRGYKGTKSAFADSGENVRAGGRMSLGEKVDTNADLASAHRAA
jgi:hypothetical protein